MAIKKLIKNAIAATGLVFVLEACAHESRNLCNTWDLQNKRKLQACVLYDNKGKPLSARYTVYNGWGLPVSTTYDLGVNGIDGNVKYFYNQHHKLKAEQSYAENGAVEEKLYDKDGKAVSVIVDEDGKFERKNVERR